MQKRRSRSIIGCVTAVAFVAAQVSLPLPALAVSIASKEAPSEVKAPFQFELDLPPDLGTIQNIHSGTGPTLIHIQDAHGNYEAQKKIAAILQHLKEKYGIKLLFVEGAADELRSDLVRMFPTRLDLSRKVLDELAREARVQASELFLLESPEVKAIGIENLQSYVANGKEFVSVLREREKAENFLRDMDTQIERLTGPYLNKDLRAFLKRLEEYEAKHLPILDWLIYLKSEAKQRLGIDLMDPAWQIDWPMLVRIVKLGDLESKMDMKGFVTERPAFLKAIQSIPQEAYREIEKLLSSTLSRNQLPDPETSLVFEKMAASLPASFNYDAYPNVKVFIGHLMLQSEVKGDRLVAEMNRLTEKISEKLARTAVEKKILSLLKDHRLLKKLFSLELAPEDYEEVAKRGETLRPKVVIGRFQELNGSKRVRAVEFTHTEEIESLFEKAVEFYRGVKERDAYLIQNIEARLRESGADKAVVITGGFHAGPFTQFFSQQGFNYALIAPKITTTDGREAYIQNLLETRLVPGQVTHSTYMDKPGMAIPAARSVFYEAKVETVIAPEGRVATIEALKDGQTLEQFNELINARDKQGQPGWAGQFGEVLRISRGERKGKPAYILALEQSGYKIIYDTTDQTVVTEQVRRVPGKVVTVEKTTSTVNAPRAKGQTRAEVRASKDTKGSALTFKDIFDIGYAINDEHIGHQIIFPAKDWDFRVESGGTAWGGTVKIWNVYIPDTRTTPEEALKSILNDNTLPDEIKERFRNLARQKAPALLSSVSRAEVRSENPPEGFIPITSETIKQLHKGDLIWGVAGRELRREEIYARIVSFIDKKGSEREVELEHLNEKNNQLAPFDPTRRRTLPDSALIVYKMYYKPIQPRAEVRNQADKLWKAAHFASRYYTFASYNDLYDKSEVQEMKYKYEQSDRQFREGMEALENSKDQATLTLLRDKFLGDISKAKMVYHSIGAQKYRSYHQLVEGALGRLQGQNPSRAEVRGLALKRRVGEKVVIDGNIIVTLAGIKEGVVSLEILTPAEISVTPAEGSPGDKTGEYKWITKIPVNQATIRIGEHITLSAIKVSDGGVRLHFVAPRNIRIDRAEVAARRANDQLPRAEVRAIQVEEKPFDWHKPLRWNQWDALKSLILTANDLRPSGVLITVTSRTGPQRRYALFDDNKRPAVKKAEIEAHEINYPSLYVWPDGDLTQSSSDVIHLVHGEGLYPKTFSWEKAIDLEGIRIETQEATTPLEGKSYNYISSLKVTPVSIGGQIPDIEFRRIPADLVTARLGPQTATFLREQAALMTRAEVRSVGFPEDTYQPDLRPVILSDFPDRTLLVLSGKHKAPALLAKFQQEVIPEVTKPENTLFLVEGSEISSEAPEVEAARQFAKEKKIVIHDPILSFENHAVIQKVVDDYHTDPRILYGAVTLLKAFERGADNSNYMSVVASVGLENMNQWGLNSPELIFQGVATLMRQIGDAQANESRREQVENRLKEHRARMVEVSNHFSEQVLRYYLKKYPEKKQVFVYLGGAHRPIFEGLDIPEGRRLTDNQIEKILGEQDHGRTSARIFNRRAEVRSAEMKKLFQEKTRLQSEIDSLQQRAVSVKDPKDRKKIRAGLQKANAHPSAVESGIRLLESPSPSSRSEVRMNLMDLTSAKVEALLNRELGIHVGNVGTTRSGSFYDVSIQRFDKTKTNPKEFEITFKVKEMEKDAEWRVKFLEAYISAFEDAFRQDHPDYFSLRKRSSADPLSVTVVFYRDIEIREIEKGFETTVRLQATDQAIHSLKIAVKAEKGAPVVLTPVYQLSEGGLFLPEPAFTPESIPVSVPPERAKDFLQRLAVEVARNVGSGNWTTPFSESYGAFKDRVQEIAEEFNQPRAEVRMLVLARKKGQKILIGNNIVVEILGIEGGKKVQVNIQTPAGIPIPGPWSLGPLVTDGEISIEGNLIKVLSIRASSVRLGISAPRGVFIDREERRERIRARQLTELEGLNASIGSTFPPAGDLLREAEQIFKKRDSERAALKIGETITALEQHPSQGSFHDIILRLRSFRNSLSRAEVRAVPVYKQMARFSIATLLNPDLPREAVQKALIKLSKLSKIRLLEEEEVDQLNNLQKGEGVSKEPVLLERIKNNATKALTSIQNASPTEPAEPEETHALEIFKELQKQLAQDLYLDGQYRAAFDSESYLSYSPTHGGEYGRLIHGFVLEEYNRRGFQSRYENVVKKVEELDRFIRRAEVREKPASDEELREELRQAVGSLQESFVAAYIDPTKLIDESIQAYAQVKEGRRKVRELLRFVDPNQESLVNELLGELNQIEAAASSRVPSGSKIFRIQATINKLRLDKSSSRYESFVLGNIQPLVAISPGVEFYVGEVMPAKEAGVAQIPAPIISAVQTVLPGYEVGPGPVRLVLGVPAERRDAPFVYALVPQIPSAQTPVVTFAPPERIKLQDQPNDILPRLNLVKASGPVQSIPVIPATIQIPVTTQPALTPSIQGPTPVRVSLGAVPKSEPKPRSETRLVLAPKETVRLGENRLTLEEITKGPKEKPGARFSFEEKVPGRSEVRTISVEVPVGETVEIKTTAGVVVATVKIEPAPQGRIKVTIKSLVDVSLIAERSLLPPAGTASLPPAGTASLPSERQPEAVPIDLEEIRRLIREGQPIPDSTPARELFFNVRAEKMFDRLHITTIKDLELRSADELLHPQFGLTGLQEVQQKLARVGRHLRGDSLPEAPPRSEVRKPVAVSRPPQGVVTPTPQQVIRAPLLSEAPPVRIDEQTLRGIFTPLDQRFTSLRFGILFLSKFGSLGRAVLAAILVNFFGVPEGHAAFAEQGTPVVALSSAQEMLGVTGPVRVNPTSEYPASLRVRFAGFSADAVGGVGFDELWANNFSRKDNASPLLRLLSFEQIAKEAAGSKKPLVAFFVPDAKKTRSELRYALTNKNNGIEGEDRGLAVNYANHLDEFIAIIELKPGETAVAAMNRYSEANPGFGTLIETILPGLKADVNFVADRKWTKDRDVMPYVALEIIHAAASIRQMKKLDPSKSAELLQAQLIRRLSIVVSIVRQNNQSFLVIESLAQFIDSLRNGRFVLIAA